MGPFRWKNCFADVRASKHAITVQSYLDDVVRPAILNLEKTIAVLGRSGDSRDAFLRAGMMDVLQQTKMAFGLSIQSIWERQLRAYLIECAKELRPNDGLASQAEKANWENLCVLFFKLRDIRLETFPSFVELETLHLLGNACRHGDGSSATELANRLPELWKPSRRRRSKNGRSNSSELTVALMDIPLTRLEAFVAAIAAFWNDAGYIYDESIRRKHPSLKTRLARERAERTWHPQAEPDGCS